MLSTLMLSRSTLMLSRSTRMLSRSTLMSLSPSSTLTLLPSRSGRAMSHHHLTPPSMPLPLISTTLSLSLSLLPPPAPTLSLSLRCVPATAMASVTEGSGDGDQTLGSGSGGDPNGDDKNKVSKKNNLSYLLRSLIIPCGIVTWLNLNIKLNLKLNLFGAIICFFILGIAIWGFVFSTADDEAKIKRVKTCLATLEVAKKLFDLFTMVD